MNARAVVAAVPDPELPMVTIEQLGILRDVQELDGRVTVTITPTYSGCPAMDAIGADIRAALAGAGYPDVEVRTVLSPAWSTDMISESGRKALAGSGIAPPGERSCPQCGSANTLQISRYAAAPCQALCKCSDCAEPFNAVKRL